MTIVYICYFYIFDTKIPDKNSINEIFITAILHLHSMTDSLEGLPD